MRKFAVFLMVLAMAPVMGAAQIDSVSSAATGHGEMVSDVAGEHRGSVAEMARGHGENVREAAKKKEKKTADYDGDSTPIIKGSGAAMVDRHGPMKTGRFEALKGGTVSNTILAGLKESTQHDEFDTEGALMEWNDGIADGDYTLIVVDGRSVEQDEYREGNDAEYAKKSWGQPSFDDLEMERGVKPGALEARSSGGGSADSARKEISVIECGAESDSNGFCGEANLKGGTVANTVLAGLVEKDDVKRGMVVASEDTDYRKAREGRNPQTGR